jgi:hypothetical protein
VRSTVWSWVRILGGVALTAGAAYGFIVSDGFSDSDTLEWVFYVAVGLAGIGSVGIGVSRLRIQRRP